MEKFIIKRQNQTTRSRMLAMLAIYLVIFNLTQMMIPNVSARYLPTRSNNDQLRRQEIKEILRLLLDLPNNSDADSSSSPMAFREPQSMLGWSNNRDVGAYDLIRGPRNIAASNAVADPSSMVASNQRTKRSNLLT